MPRRTPAPTAAADDTSATQRPGRGEHRDGERADGDGTHLQAFADAEEAGEDVEGSPPLHRDDGRQVEQCLTGAEQGEGQQARASALMTARASMATTQSAAANRVDPADLADPRQARDAERTHDR